MKKNDSKRDFFKWVDSMIVVLFFSGTLLFLFLTGTLNSGYHFIDDHEMLAIDSNLGKSSLIDTAAQYIRNDFNIRFRPLYYLHRVLELKIFGINFFSLSFYTGILAAFTFSLFYIGARTLKYSIVESLLLVLLTFVGSQMAVWWRLGPNETIGMVFLGLSFLFLARSTGGKNYFWNSVLFNLFLVLASLSKENFVALIPALVFYKIWNESRTFNISLKNSISKNYLALVSLFVMVLEFWLIIFVIGTKNLGYAGSSSSVQEFFWGIYNILTNEEMLLRWLKLIPVLLLFYFCYLVFLKYRDKICFKENFQKIIPSLIFSLIILVSSMVFYAKSGMVERYLLPATFGMAFYIIDMISQTRQRIFQWGMIFVCVIFAILSFNIAKKNALAFAMEGRQTNELIDAVIKNIEPNSDNLLVADPVGRFEATYSLKRYVALKGIEGIYGYPVIIDHRVDYGSGLEKKWKEGFEGRTFEKMHNYPKEIIFLDKWQAEKFFSDTGIREIEYQNILAPDNFHALYIRR